MKGGLSNMLQCQADVAQRPGQKDCMSTTANQVCKELAYVCVCVTVCILHSESMLTLYETSHARKAVKCHVQLCEVQQRYTEQSVGVGRIVWPEGCE